MTMGIGAERVRRRPSADLSGTIALRRLCGVASAFDSEAKSVPADDGHETLNAYPTRTARLKGKGLAESHQAE